MSPDSSTSLLQAANVPVQTKGKAVTVHLSNEIPRTLRQAMGRDESFTGRFDLPLEEGEVYLGRTSPIIEGLAGWTLDQALDPVAREGRATASRCGVVSSSAVQVRTTLLVARFRYHLQIAGAHAETLLCEEIVPLACTGSADAPQWLTPEEGEQLLTARPERNLVGTAIEQQIALLLPTLPKLQVALEARRTRACGRAARRPRTCAGCHTYQGPRHRAARAPGRHSRGLCPLADAELIMSRRATDFQTIRSEGGLLPTDLLRRVLDPKEKLEGTRPEDYRLLRDERLNEVITQSWNRLRRHWAEFRAAATNLPEGEAGTGLTNDKWNLPLLRELGFGLLPTSAGPEISGRTYAINRFFGPVPIHLVGCGVSLDRRAAGVRGAAAANPHGLVQEFLNRSPDHLWAIVTNCAAISHPARQSGPLATILSRVRS